MSTSGTTHYGRAELLVADAGELAEGARYDERNATLSWVDIPAGRLHRMAADGTRTRFEIDRPLGCAQPTRRGRLMLATETGFALASSDLATVAPIGTQAERPTAVRFNDGGADPEGRFFAGTMNYDEVSPDGELYRLDPDGPVRVRDGLTISNGIGWSSNGRWMYHIDSPPRLVTRSPYDPLAGTVGDPEVFWQATESDGFPDGLCLDAEDHVWIAMWGGHAVRRFAPDGREVGRVEVPAERVTSVAFGGPGFSTLFVTTAGDGLFRCSPGPVGVSCPLVDDGPFLGARPIE